MRLAPVAAFEVASVVAVALSVSSLWFLSARRRQGRKMIEARIASLGETVVDISNKPFHSAAWGTAGLTLGAVVHRVVSRTADGEQRVREWAYDPAAASGIKTFAHGVWIPLA